MKIIHTNDPDFFDTAYFDDPDFNYSASITSWTSTKIVFTNSDNGAKTHLTGTGFTVDGSGNITAGTITKFAFKDSGVTNSVWKDLSWSGADWQAILDEFQVDEQGLFGNQITAEPLVYDASGYVSADGDGVGFSFAISLEPITFLGSAYSDTIDGSKAADTLSGGAGGDRLVGKGGADTINGDGGADILLGGNGADHLEGGTGKDVMLGGLGHDTMLGGDGDDKMLGDEGISDTADGDDKMYGNAGDDQMHGGGGNDRLEGGTGKDEVEGGTGRDILLGGSQSDKLHGHAGKDVLKGGKGNDHLNGGKGDDILTGNAGNDRFIFTGNQIGSDRITDFTDDVDTLRFDFILLGGGLSKADVIATYASVVGGDVVFDFGGGHTVTLTGVSDTAVLLNDMDFI